MYLILLIKNYNFSTLPKSLVGGNSSACKDKAFSGDNPKTARKKKRGRINSDPSSHKPDQLYNTTFLPC